MSPSPTAAVIFLWRMSTERTIMQINAGVLNDYILQSLQNLPGFGREQHKKKMTLLEG
jgi:hypothetical protein